MGWKVRVVMEITRRNYTSRQRSAILTKRFYRVKGYDKNFLSIFRLVQSAVVQVEGRILGDQLINIAHLAKTVVH